LHWHHFSDLVVDAVSPVSFFFWRRASTFCKAGSKIQLKRLLAEKAMEVGDLLPSKEER
jgi:hypothetical protein